MLPWMHRGMQVWRNWDVLIWKHQYLGGRKKFSSQDLTDSASLILYLFKIRDLQGATFNYPGGISQMMSHTHDTDQIVVLFFFFWFGGGTHQVGSFISMNRNSSWQYCFFGTRLVKYFASPKRSTHLFRKQGAKKVIPKLDQIARFFCWEISLSVCDIYNYIMHVYMLHTFNNYNPCCQQDKFDRQNIHCEPMMRFVHVSKHHSRHETLTKRWEMQELPSRKVYIVADCWNLNTRQDNWENYGTTSQKTLLGYKILGLKKLLECFGYG